MSITLTKNDLRIIPFSPLSQKDRAEFRVQFFNNGESKDFKVDFYIDDKNNLIESKTVNVLENSFGCVSAWKPMSGQAGEHKIIVCVDGQEIQDDFSVLEKPINALDGGFVLLSGAENITCMQPYGGGMERFTDDEWKLFLDEYNELGFKAILIQMTVAIDDYDTMALGAHYDGCSIFPRAKSKAKDAIKAILEQAEKNGQKVFIGMCSPISHHDIHSIEKLVKEIYAIYGKYSAFYGWYSSWEFSLSIEPNIDHHISVHLDEIALLRKFVDDVSPVMPILYSPFIGAFTEKHDVNNGISTGVINALHENKLKIDILCPHDRCGQTPMMTNQQMIKPESAIREYALLYKACENTNVHLWANVESFNFEFVEDPSDKLSSYYKYSYGLVPRQVGGGVMGENGMIHHLEEIRRYTEKNITFMLTGVFQKPDSPVKVGNASSIKYYTDYKNYLKNPIPHLENVALGCSYQVESTHRFYDPDNGHSFQHDDCDKGGVEFLHPDLEKGGLATDGIMSGAQTRRNDDYLIFGTQLYSRGEKAKIALTIDLGKEINVKKVRAMRPLNKDFGADFITVYTSVDGKKFKKIGKSATYVRGYLSVDAKKQPLTRFVKVVMEKTNQEEWKNWFYVDEVEVLA